MSENSKTSGWKNKTTYHDFVNKNCRFSLNASDTFVATGKKSTITMRLLVACLLLMFNTNGISAC